MTSWHSRTASVTTVLKPIKKSVSFIITFKMTFLNVMLKITLCVHSVMLQFFGPGWEWWVVVWTGKGQEQSLVPSPWAYCASAMIAIFFKKKYYSHEHFCVLPASMEPTPTSTHGFFSHLLPPPGTLPSLMGSRSIGQAVSLMNITNHFFLLLCYNVSLKFSSPGQVFWFWFLLE